MPSARPASRLFSEGLLHLVFFLSGFAAILYQLVWQRSLFTIYGTSSESVTIVVTVFMLGLGIGGLLGGALSRGARWSLPVLFGIAELLIGAFVFAHLGQQGAVRLAVGVNFAVAACVLGAFLRRKIAA